MLDLGWTEIVVIAVVLIIVVGPKDLPQMLRSFGRTMKKLRSMAGEFRSQFDEALKEAELDDVRKTVSDARKLNPARELRDAMNPLRKAGEEIRDDLDRTFKKESENRPAGPSGKPGQTDKPGDAEKVAKPDPAAPSSSPAPGAPPASKKKAADRPKKGAVEANGAAGAPSPASAGSPAAKTRKSAAQKPAASAKSAPTAKRASSGKSAPRKKSAAATSAATKKMGDT